MKEPMIASLEWYRFLKKVINRVLGATTSTKVVPVVTMVITSTSIRLFDGFLVQENPHTCIRATVKLVEDF